MAKEWRSAFFRRQRPLRSQVEGNKNKTEQEEKQNGPPIPPYPFSPLMSTIFFVCRWLNSKWEQYAEREAVNEWRDYERVYLIKCSFLLVSFNLQRKMPKTWWQEQVWAVKIPRLWCGLKENLFACACACAQCLETIIFVLAFSLALTLEPGLFFIPFTGSPRPRLSIPLITMFFKSFELCLCLMSISVLRLRCVALFVCLFDCCLCPPLTLPCCLFCQTKSAQSRREEKRGAIEWDWILC